MAAHDDRDEQLTPPELETLLDSFLESTRADQLAMLRGWASKPAPRPRRHRYGASATVRLSETEFARMSVPRPPGSVLKPGIRVALPGGAGVGVVRGWAAAGDPRLDGPVVQVPPHAGARSHPRWFPAATASWLTPVK